MGANPQHRAILLRCEPWLRAEFAQAAHEAGQSREQWIRDVCGHAATHRPGTPTCPACPADHPHLNPAVADPEGVAALEFLMSLE